MDQLVMSQIGVNGLTVLLNVTLVQEQGTGIMNTQTEALIVLMTFMKLILAEVSYLNNYTPLQIFAWSYISYWDVRNSHPLYNLRCKVHPSLNQFF